MLMSLILQAEIIWCHYMKYRGSMTLLNTLGLGLIAAIWVTISAFANANIFDVFMLFIMVVW